MVLRSRDGSLIGVATNYNTPVRHGITTAVSHQDPRQHQIERTAPGGTWSEQTARMLNILGFHWLPDCGSGEPNHRVDKQGMLAEGRPAHLD
jgi:hypothetical protein